MKKLLFTFLILVGFVFTTSVYSQILSNGTGGGDWNTGTTWIGGLAPIATDNVIIQGSDIVTLAAAGTCANLQMNAGTKLTIATGLILPGTSWNLAVTSTVEYLGVPSAFVYTSYGNLIYSGANYSLASNLTVNGNLTVTTATLRGIGTTSGSLIHTVAGNVIIGPGTSARISAVNQSAATTASCTWNIGGNLSLTSDNSGNRMILFESTGPHSGTAKYIIGGNLNIGTTSGSASQLQYRSSSGSVAYGTGIVDLKGNLTKHGKIGVQSGATAGTFTLNLIGTNNQSWSGAGSLDIQSGSITLNINVNNAGGVTLNVPQTIGSNVILTLTNGVLTTDATNLLTIGAGSLTGGNATSYVSGPLARTIAGNGLYSFPVGKGGYSPASLNFTSGTYTSASATVEAFNIIHPNYILFPTDYLARYWKVSQSGISSFSCGATFKYVDADIIGNENNIYLQKYDNPTWLTLNVTNAATNELSATVTSFSDFWGADLAAAPVELTSFNVNSKNGIVQLSWRTSTETNSSKFDVEKKSANTTWMKIGEVAASGNSNSPKDYNFIDKNVMVGKYQYRIKMVDADGSYEYSNVVEAEVSQPTEFSLLQNYPNPFNPSTTINYSLPIDSRVSLELYSLVGEKVADLVNEAQVSGFYSYNFNTSNLNLTSGVYLYKLTAVSNSNEVFSQSMKMLLLK